MKNLMRCCSLFVVAVGLSTGGVCEASFINFSLNGPDNVGFSTNFFIPTATDFVTLSLTVDTNTVVNVPSLSTISPGYMSGSALATISLSDPTYGQFTTTVMAHATVSQVFALPQRGGFIAYYTEIQFIADSGPSSGSVIGEAFLLPTQAPSPVTYNLMSPLTSAGVGGVFASLQGSGGVSAETGLSTPSGTQLYFQNFSAGASVPEPSSFALCGLAGTMGMIVAGVRRRRLAEGQVRSDLDSDNDFNAVPLVHVVRPFSSWG